MEKYLAEYPVGKFTIEPLSTWFCGLPIKMTSGRNLRIHLFDHEFSLLCVSDDSIHLTRRALTELEEEG
jgi:hypothetical protein